MAAAAVLLLTFTLVTASWPEPVPEPLGQQIPMWTDRPIDVGTAFVGVTKNATSSAMPQFGVGSVRLWNSGTRWEKLEAFARLGGYRHCDADRGAQHVLRTRGQRRHA